MYFNLTGTEASDPVADFEIANFGKVTLDDTGDPLVIALLPGATAPLTLVGDDDLPAAVLDLGGQSLVGTNGVNGDEARETIRRARTADPGNEHIRATEAEIGAK